MQCRASTAEELHGSHRALGIHGGNQLLSSADDTCEHQNQLKPATIPLRALLELEPGKEEPQLLFIHETTDSHLTKMICYRGFLLKSVIKANSIM